METLIVPITTGLVQVLKLSFFNSKAQKKFLPLLTLSIAVLITMFNENFQPVPEFGTALFQGLIFGLSACGLYETAVSPIGDAVNDYRDGQK